MRAKELRKKSKKRIDIGYIQAIGIQSYADENL